MTARRYTVRKQTSGRTSSETFYVYDKTRKCRVSVHATHSREAAQSDADALNITDMIRDYVDDPRPYGVRRAEARDAYYSAKENQS